MADDHFDIIIIGGGAMGLATAYYLSQTQKKVLLLEQFAFIHQRGSSAGQSRFFRILYADPFYALWGQAAYPLWLELAEKTDLPIFTPRDVLFYGVEEEHQAEGLTQTRQTMQALDVPFREYDGASLEAAFPMFKHVPAGYVGFQQATSALLRPDLILRVFYDTAQQHGVILRDNEPVYRIDWHSSESITVTTNRKQYRTAKLVLTPGAWANSLLDKLYPVRLQLYLTIWQLTLAYWSVDDHFVDAPLWYEYGQANDNKSALFYGVPPAERPGEMKSGTDFVLGEYDSPDQVPYQPEARILTYVQQFLQQRFHGVSSKPEPGSVSTCLYTLPYDRNFILDFVPETDNIILFTGGSGRAFKFTPLIGTILTELALVGTTHYNIVPFSIHRAKVLR